MESFFDYYSLHNSTENVEPFIKSPIGKCCRFCGKSHPDVSFDTKPHIVPELMGRNKMLSNFECDNCNQAFQKYETDTATMIQHYLTLCQVKSKRNIPAFQSKKQPFEESTTLKMSENKMQFSFGGNLDDFEYDEDKKSLTVRFRTKKFSPYAVYKVFLKMALSLLTVEELNKNPHYLNFLHAPEPIRNGMQYWTGCRYMLKTKYHQVPKVNLYKAKVTLIDRTEFPEYVAMVNFANITFQFFLPISEKNMAEHLPEHTLRAELIPAFVLDDIKQLSLIDVYLFDFDKTEKVSITDSVKFYYDSKFPIEILI